jgi:membrane protein YqaA with SNARE-associated domain
MIWGNIVALIVGGLVGWWLGRSQARNAVNRRWMESLESAEVDGIIDQGQRSTLIRIQGAHR